MQLKRPALKRQPAYHGRNINSAIPPAPSSSTSPSSACSSTSPCSSGTPGSDSPCGPATPAPLATSRVEPPLSKNALKLVNLPTFYYTDGNVVFGYQSPSGFPLSPGEVIYKQNITEVNHEAGAGKNYFDNRTFGGLFGPLTTSLSTPTLETSSSPFFVDSNGNLEVAVERNGRQ